MVALFGTACFVVAFVGLVLLLTAAVGRDRDLLGSGFAVPALFDLPVRDQDEVDKMHPPEAHRGRLALIGGALLLAGVGGMVLGIVLSG